MARVSPQELLNRVEKGKVIPAILLLGEEPYLRDACREKLIEKFVPEASRTWAVSRYSAIRRRTFHMSSVRSRLSGSNWVVAHR